MTQPEVSMPLSGKRIAVPESRYQDVLDGLLSRRGANVTGCPLVTTVDAPDPGPVLEWLNRFIDDPPDFLVLLTGEGLIRLHGFAERSGISSEQFRRALQRTTLISRGPKPARELRVFEMTPDLFAVAPTTDGVIETFNELPLDGATVGIQLYGDDPNQKLVDYLVSRKADVSTVAPYRYAPDASKANMQKLIADLHHGRFDAIVFTSKSQVNRLFSFAANAGTKAELEIGLQRTCVAAVGPIVADVLSANGCRVDVMPEKRFFMKPLVQALSEAL
ncbi:MAG: uroporphyrinogen-III synthase [Pseudomonadota bacterium]